MDGRVNGVNEGVAPDQTVTMTYSQPMMSYIDILSCTLILLSRCVSHHLLSLDNVLSIRYHTMGSLEDFSSVSQTKKWRLTPYASMHRLCVTLNKFRPENTWLASAIVLIKMSCCCATLYWTLQKGWLMCLDGSWRPLTKHQYLTAWAQVVQWLAL